MEVWVGNLNEDVDPYAPHSYPPCKLHVVFKPSMLTPSGASHKAYQVCTPREQVFLKRAGHRPQQLVTCGDRCMLQYMKMKNSITLA